MSARDLARFGLLFLNNGRWNDVSVVPSQWTAESTKAYSHTDRKDRGYGYLWWTLDAGAWGTGAIFASGYGGQLIVIVPEKHLVAVQVVELDQGQPGIHSATFLDLVQQVLAKRRAPGAALSSSGNGRVVMGNVSAPSTLYVVETFVRAPRERADGISVDRCSQADARAYRDGIGPDDERSFKCDYNTLCRTRGVRCSASCFKKYRKLVATETRNEMTAFEFIEDACSNRLEQFVARFMPMCIVHSLKSIEINHGHDREASCQPLLKRILERWTVCKAR